MKLTAKIKLNPTEEQRQLLHETLQRANAACNYISDIVWNSKVFRTFDLHHACYYDVRERFELTAQIVVRALGKVADAYKKDRKSKRQFKKHGAFPFDQRVLKYNVSNQNVNIWTLAGRQRIPFQAGPRQLQLLQTQQGESELAFIRGEFYLFATCDVDEPTIDDVDGFMGVDMGIVNIATTDDGQIYSGKVVNQVRHRNRRIRAKLQRKGTKSAKRLLRKISGREQRFSNDVNHCISKAIVHKAKRTGRGIAVEILDGIRGRVRLRKSQRTQLHNWSFSDLRFKIEYKSLMLGVPVVAVDPRNTSRKCSACGHIDKRNRKTQDKFVCIACEFSAHADVNAAINIGRGAINHPYAVNGLGANPA